MKNSEYRTTNTTLSIIILNTNIKRLIILFYFHKYKKHKHQKQVYFVKISLKDLDVVRRVDFVSHVRNNIRTGLPSGRRCSGHKKPQHDVGAILVVFNLCQEKEVPALKPGGWNYKVTLKCWVTQSGVSL